MPEVHERIRAFIAVDIPTDIKERIVRAAKELESEGIRVVAAEQMHITLFFLGYIDAAQVEATKGIMSSIGSRRFGVSLHGIGTFAIKRPRVIFANIRDGAKELHDIYETVSNGMPALMKLEKEEFTPHLTVARLKRFDSATTGRARDFIESYKDMDFGSFECKEIKLKQSVLTNEGAVHSDIHVKELEQ
jgi:2'-5' RNA ligase